MLESLRTISVILNLGSVLLTSLIITCKHIMPSYSHGNTIPKYTQVLESSNKTIRTFTTIATCVSTTFFLYLNG